MAFVEKSVATRTRMIQLAGFAVLLAGCGPPSASHPTPPRPVVTVTLVVADMGKQLNLL